MKLVKKSSKIVVSSLYFFSRFFDLVISPKFYFKMSQINPKLVSFAWFFIFWAYFETLKMHEKSSKKWVNLFTFSPHFSISTFSHNFTLKWVKSMPKWFLLPHLSYFELISKPWKSSKNRQKPWVNPFTFSPHFSNPKIHRTSTLKWLKSMPN